MTKILALALFVLISPAAQSQGLPDGCDPEQMQVLANSLGAQAICDYLAPESREARLLHLRALADASPACYQKITSEMAEQIQELNESVPAMVGKLPAPVKEWYLVACADPRKLDAVGASGDGR